jgi:RNase P subunit RPR2
MSGSERVCNNCNKPTRLDRALTVQKNGRLVAVICEGCQQAQKIQVTLDKPAVNQQWEFYQYFPVEA